MRGIVELWVYQVILQVITVIQFICIIDLFLEKQKLSFRKLLYALVALVVLYSVFLPHFRNANFYIIINTIVICSVLYQGKILNKVFCIVISLAISAAAEMLNQAFIDQFMRGYLSNDRWEKLILQIGSMILILVFVIILKNKNFLNKNKRAYEVMLKKEIIALSIVAIFSIVIVFMGMLIYSGGMKVTYNRVFLCIIMLGAVLLDLSLLVIIDHSARVDYYKKLNQVIEGQLCKQLTYYERLEVVNQETRAIKHDMRNHMLVIHNLLEDGQVGELRRYVTDITKSVMINEKFIRTGNPIADAILNEKHYIAGEQKINMNVNLQLSKEISIDAVDLCTILSNSIDNAIEACAKIEREEDREIKITGGINGGYLIIQVINKMQGEIMIRNNTIRTSKKDEKQHGHGLANIKESVNKYKGEFILSLKENYFMLEVIINTSYV